MHGDWLYCRRKRNAGKTHRRGAFHQLVVYYRLCTNTTHIHAHTKKRTRVSVKHAPRSTNEHYLSLSFTLMFYLIPLSSPTPIPVNPHSSLTYDARRRLSVRIFSINGKFKAWEIHHEIVTFLLIHNLSSLIISFFFFLSILFFFPFVSFCMSEW